MIYDLLHSSSEIPQFRLPYDVVSFEIELMKDLGVKVNIFSTFIFVHSALLSFVYKTKRELP